MSSQISQVSEHTDSFGWLPRLRTQCCAYPPGTAAINQHIGVVAGQNSCRGIQSGLAREVG